MPTAEIDAICRDCGHRFRAQPSRSFLGFLELKCPACSKAVTYPLTKSYRIGYLVLLPLFAFFFAYSLSHGEIQLSGIAAIAILVALARDWQVRRQIAVARRASGPAGGT